MFRKSKDRPKVHITSKGAKSVDVEQLFQSPRVIELLEKMKEFEAASNKSQEDIKISTKHTN